MDIAIVGMACRFPGAANPSQLARKLFSGVNSVYAIPEDRWEPAPSSEDAQTRARSGPWAGILERIDHFDAHFFGISPQEAQLMDPQQRLLLEEVIHCLESAGIGAGELAAVKTSVFTGLMANDYYSHVSGEDVEPHVYSCLGNYQGILANRISHLLNLTGESLCIDTACSSSLVALHHARLNLEAGRSEYSIVAGVNLICHPLKTEAFTRAHMLSPHGQCRTFSHDADGYVAGEGAGVLLLRRLDRAIAGGNPILGVLQGTAVSHGGKTPSITAPSVDSQRELLLDAYKGAGVDPADLTYLEAHGTGTSLGDPIEVEALTQAFRVFTDKQGYCEIGSIKANIGHLEAAAGIAGVIKILLMFKEGRIPPCLNITRKNPIIDFDRGPFLISREAHDWKPSGPRLAGVSSFGFGGVLSHAVLREYEPEPAVGAPARAWRPDTEAYPFLLSAKSRQSLIDSVFAWQRWVQSGKFAATPLPRLCAELACREPYAFRLGALVRSHEDLVEWVNRGHPEALPASRPPAGTSVLCIGTVAGRGLGERDPALMAILERERIRFEPVLQALEEGKRGFGRDILNAYALALRLIEQAPGFSMLAGQGAGFWAASLLGGWILPGDLPALLSGGAMAKPENRMPILPLWIPVRKGPAYPLEITPAYLRALRDGLACQAGDFLALLSKCRDIHSTQRTFQKIIAQWDRHLGKHRLEMAPLLLGEEAYAVQDEAVRLLHYLVLASSLRKLSLKWNIAIPLHDSRAQADELFLLLETIPALEDSLADFILHFSSDLARELAARSRADAPSGAEAKRYPLLCGHQDYRRAAEAWAASGAGGGSAPPIGDLEAHGRVFWLGNGAPPEAAGIFASDPGDWPRPLMEMWLEGHKVAWGAPERVGNLQVSLPSYAFDRKSFWVGGPKDGRGRRSHLLNPKPGDAEVFTRVYDVEEDRILWDHRILGRTILPATGILDQAMAAVRKAEGGAGIVYSNLSFQIPGVIEGLGTARVSVDRKAGKIDFTLGKSVLFVGKYALEEGRIEPSAPVEIPAPEGPPYAHDLYETIRPFGYGHGFSFQVIRHIVEAGDALWFHLVSSKTEEGGESGINPFLLDAVFQALVYSSHRWFSILETDSIFVPFAIRRFETVRPFGNTWVVRIAKDQIAVNGSQISATLQVLDGSGRLVCILDKATMRKAPNTFLGGAAPGAGETLPRLLEERWSEADRKGPHSPLPEGCVLVGSAGHGGAQAMARALAARFATAASFVCAGDNAFAQDIKAFAAGLDARGKKLLQAYYVVGPAGDADSLEEIRAFFHFLRSFLLFRGAEKRRLTLVSRNAHAIRASDAADPGHSSCLFSMALSAAKETPHFEVQWVDADGGWEPVEPPSGSLEQVLGDSLAPDPDGVVAYREGRRWIKGYREKAFSGSAALSKEGLFQDGKTYLLTGCLGGFGYRLLMSLSGIKANLIIAGRSGLDAEKAALIGSLRARFPRVEYVRADVGDEEDCLRIVRETEKWGMELSGVLHLAAVLNDRLLLNHTWESFAAVLKPKIQGVQYLDKATRHQPLDFFVAFSSIVSLAGNAGQSAYACGNAFLDAFAGMRRARGGSGMSCSLAWPLITDGGMGRQEGITGKFERMGLKSLSVREALPVLQRLAEVYAPRLSVFHPDSGMLNALLVEPALEKRSDTETKEKTMQQAPHSGIKEQIAGEVAQILAEVMSLPRGEIGNDVDIREYGVDSIAITKIIDRLDVNYEQFVYPSLLMEYPTIGALSAHLEKEISISGMDQSRFRQEVRGQTPEAVPAPAPAAAPAPEAPGPGGLQIAIVAYAGRFPGSPDVETYWERIAGKKDCLREVPPERWSLKEFYDPGAAPDKSYVKMGGFLDDVAGFDNGYFNITDKQAREMDPQQRILLEIANELFERAGYSRKSIHGSSMGVFIGANESNYARHVARRKKFSGEHGVVNTVTNLIAGRISDFYNLTGPSQVCYTACSSSLVAIHNACLSILNGDCETAIAGGVELLLDEEWFVGFSNAKALSSDGISHVFDEKANGFALGEGAGVLLLKPLARALRDGDQIQGVIRASAINNDGSTMGLTTPNKEAQKKLIQSALEKSGVGPETITYYEAHGTGTRLGDPIEVKAATEAYQAHTDKRQYCAMGSVKSNIGHLMSAAGVAGIIKILLAFKHRKLPPTIHCDKPNPKFHFESGPFYLNKDLRPWEKTAGVRRAAVSSFGFGGTNTHMILDEFDAEAGRYAPRFQPLPLTRFRKTRHWIENARDEDEAALEILNGLSRETISLESALGRLDSLSLF
jgi:acyl transferase domain-containing protein/NAD(P)-dependent dehydrogenase (short-subunit alcohol dehydrogenase family)/acyl carrier protein